MEEVEVSSWLTLDALKKASEVVETVGNLQTGHCQSVFCVIEDDHLELLYCDTAPNAIRLYEDRDEFDEALEERKEEVGEAPFDEDEELDLEEDEDEEEDEEDLEEEDEDEEDED